MKLMNLRSIKDHQTSMKMNMKMKMKMTKMNKIFLITILGRVEFQISKVINMNKKILMIQIDYFDFFILNFNFLFSYINILL